MPFKDPDKAREANRLSYAKHKESRKAQLTEERRQAKIKYMAEWRESNRERHREGSKDWYRRNREDILKRQKAAMDLSKFEGGPLYLSKVLRNRLYIAIKRGYKSGSAVQDLGCSIEEFKAHIEKQFHSGMTWANHGMWHLDHIKPLASFDLSDREQFLQACHYTNYQPLLAFENLQKGKREI